MQQKPFFRIFRSCDLIFPPAFSFQTRLEKTVAEKFCRTLVCEILEGIQTPERPASLVEFLTETSRKVRRSNPLSSAGSSP